MLAQRATLPCQSFHVAGDDALTFLQGQLTQDIRLITENTCHYAGYCNAKGQLFASMLIRAVADGFVLRLHNAVAESVIKRLTLFKLRNAVNITALTDPLIALNKTAASQLAEFVNVPLPKPFTCLTGDGFSLCALPHDIFELSVDNTDAISAVMNDIDDNADAMAIERLRGGLFNIYPETSEQLFPQDTTLETFGAINYQKGCYVGQEIIARSKYRGKVRKTMGYAEIDAAVHLTLPAPIHLDGKTVGQVVDYHQTQFNTYCLAIISLDSVNQPVTVAGQQTTFSAFT